MHILMSLEHARRESIGTNRADTDMNRNTLRMQRRAHVNSSRFVPLPESAVEPLNSRR